jgi:hypothetical protein
VKTANSISGVWCCGTAHIGGVGTLFREQSSLDGVFMRIRATLVWN